MPAVASPLAIKVLDIHCAFVHNFGHKGAYLTKTYMSVKKGIQIF